MLRMLWMLLWVLHPEVLLLPLQEEPELNPGVVPFPRKVMEKGQVELSRPEGVGCRMEGELKTCTHACEMYNDPLISPLQSNATNRNLTCHGAVA